MEFGFKRLENQEILGKLVRLEVGRLGVLNGNEDGTLLRGEGA